MMSVMVTLLGVAGLLLLIVAVIWLAILHAGRGARR